MLYSPVNVVRNRWGFVLCGLLLLSCYFPLTPLLLYVWIISVSFFTLVQATLLTTAASQLQWQKQLFTFFWFPFTFPPLSLYFLFSLSLEFTILSFYLPFNCLLHSLNFPSNFPFLFQYFIFPFHSHLLFLYIPFIFSLLSIDFPWDFRLLSLHFPLLSNLFYTIF